MNVLRNSLAALVFASAASSVSAQPLPVFDEAKGFEVLGVLGHEGIVVKNAGALFVCHVNGDVEKDGYLLMDPCYPIVTAQALAAAAAEQVQANPALTEAMLLDMLEILPIGTFKTAISEAIRARGCSIDRDTARDDVFRLELAQQAAILIGYDGELTEEIIDEMMIRFDEAGEMMLAAGEMLFQDGAIILLDCE